MRREGDTVTLARHWPPVFDVSGDAAFPAVRPGRLAHQIRQDMWRELKKLKGFAPAVEITLGDPFTVRAGGRVARHIPPRIDARIADLLEDPANRKRWLAYARYRT